jgi:hypothetical protein
VCCPSLDQHEWNATCASANFRTIFPGNISERYERKNNVLQELYIAIITAVGAEQPPLLSEVVDRFLADLVGGFEK